MNGRREQRRRGWSLSGCISLPGALGLLRQGAGHARNEQQQADEGERRTPHGLTLIISNSVMCRSDRRMRAHIGEPERCERFEYARRMPREQLEDRREPGARISGMQMLTAEDANRLTVHHERHGDERATRRRDTCESCRSTAIRAWNRLGRAAANGIGQHAGVGQRKFSRGTEVVHGVEAKMTPGTQRVSADEEQRQAIGLWLRGRDQGIECMRQRRRRVDGTQRIEQGLEARF